MRLSKESPILVTGGAGFIGSHFVMDWIAAEGTPVINLDKLTYAASADNLVALKDNPLYHFVRADISDSDIITDLLTKYQPRAVIHFAAESHVDRSINDPLVFLETNVMGTARLLQSVRGYMDTLDADDRNDFRFLHVSTDEVFGSLDKDSPAFIEDNAYAPNSPYAASKAASDHLVRAWHVTYGLPTITVNCSNNYGPYQFPEKLIPVMIMNALAGKILPIYGDGQHIRDWIYVTDNCNAIRHILSEGALGESYNIGAGNERTNIDTVNLLCDMLDDLRPRLDKKSYRDQIQFVDDRAGHDRRYAINAEKIKNKTGWKPTETFTSGLKKTIEWYLNNPEWMRDKV